MKKLHTNRLFAATLCASQILLMLFYGLFFSHFLELNPFDYQSTFTDSVSPMLSNLKDVNAITFILFIQQTFDSSKNQQSKITRQLIIGILTIQFYFLWSQFWAGIWYGFTPLRINSLSLIQGSFCGLSSIIASFVYSNQFNELQVFLINSIFAFLYSFNEQIIFNILGVRDLGRTISVFLFGSVFGVFVDFCFNFRAKKSKVEKEKKNENNQENLKKSFDLFLGLILFVFFPFFNCAACLDNINKNMAFINSYFSVFASVIGCITTLVILQKEADFWKHLKNAVSAGGIIIGASSDFLEIGCLSFLIGIFAGILSVLSNIYYPLKLKQIGFEKSKKLTSGFLLPAFFGGIFSIIFRKVWVDNSSSFQAASIFLSIGLAGFFGGLISVLSRLLKINDVEFISVDKNNTTGESLRRKSDEHVLINKNANDLSKESLKTEIINGKNLENSV